MAHEPRRHGVGEMSEDAHLMRFTIIAAAITAAAILAYPAVAAADPAICHNGVLSDDAGQGCADGLYQQVFLIVQTSIPRRAQARSSAAAARRTSSRAATIASAVACPTPWTETSAVVARRKAIASGSPKRSSSRR